MVNCRPAKRQPHEGSRRAPQSQDSSLFRADVILVSYRDMLRVPGSKSGRRGQTETRLRPGKGPTPIVFKISYPDSEP